MLPTVCASTTGEDDADGVAVGVGVGLAVDDGVAVVLPAVPPEGEPQAARRIAIRIDAAPKRNQVISHPSSKSSGVVT
jgi:hypothetical protein